MTTDYRNLRRSDFPSPQSTYNILLAPDGVNRLFRFHISKKTLSTLFGDDGIQVERVIGFVESQKAAMARAIFDRSANGSEEEATSYLDWRHHEFEENRGSLEAACNLAFAAVYAQRAGVIDPDICRKIIAPLAVIHRKDAALIYMAAEAASVPGTPTRMELRSIVALVRLKKAPLDRQEFIQLLKRGEQGVPDKKPLSRKILGRVTRAQQAEFVRAQRKAIHAFKRKKPDDSFKIPKFSI